MLQSVNFKWLIFVGNCEAHNRRRTDDGPPTPGENALSSTSYPPRTRGLTRALTGAAVLALAMLAGAGERTRAAGETRTLTFFNIHNNETTTIDFKRDGQFVAGALDKFNWTFRDWRKNEPTKMDPALIDLLWEIHTELGSKQPIHIISGYRSRGTNEALRATVGGQASESRHILGKAADVHFPDVPLKALRYSALIRERGGVGYYPTSAIEFVHIDTDRVRHWPRLPRHELALLFPDGHSQHQPADGRPITPDDVRVAKVEHRDLARQITAFYDSRAGRRPTIALAGLETAVSPTPTMPATQPAAGPVRSGVQVAAYQPPQLVETPRIVDRPSRFAVPTATEQAHLNDLLQRASFTPQTREPPRLLMAPQLVSRPKPQALPTTMASFAPIPDLPPPLAAAQREPMFVSAPEFDEDHPDELSYRPFPIAPLMTTTASADDPALAIMTHPDFARTFDLLDQTGSTAPMRLRPSLKVAEMLWTQQFTGDAVNFSSLQDRVADGTAAGINNRKVRTQ